MRTETTQKKRLELINLLAPLGLPTKHIAEAAKCSLATIHKDLNDLGGLKKAFPDRPTGGDAYASVLKYYMEHRTESWDRAPERRPIENFLGLSDVRTFALGMYACYYALHHSSYKSGDAGTVALFSELTRQYFALEDDAVNGDLQVDIWLGAVLGRCRRKGSWPKSAKEFNLFLTEYVRTDVRRDDLVSGSFGDPKATLQNALAELPERELRVLRDRYGLGGQKPKDHSEIGRELGLSREHVRQAERNGLRQVYASKPGHELRRMLGSRFGDVKGLYEDFLRLNSQVAVRTMLIKKAYVLYRGILESLGPEHPLVIEHADVFSRGTLLEHYAKRVDELDLSVRSQNCLQNAGIEYIYQLVEKTETDLLKTKNFGRKSINEIKEVLGDLGLSLGMKLPKTLVDILDS